MYKKGKTQKYSISLKRKQFVNRNEEMEKVFTCRLEKLQ
jgi:hypothetical protein